MISKLFDFGQKLILEIIYLAYVAMSCWAFGTFLWESVASKVYLFNFLNDCIFKSQHPHH